jgi:SNF2 family DNA or RNA helicase
MNSVLSPEPTRLPKLHLSLRQTPPVVEVRREDGIGDIFWLQARAEWGSNGKVPARAITLPLEQFLANSTWLGPACRKFKVEIEWEEGLKRQVMAANAERRTLDGTLRLFGVEPVPTSGVEINSGRFLRALRPFQTRDLNHLLRLAHGANFSVPGAGKTAVAYATYEAERVRGRVQQMLVVAPLSAFDSWLREVEVCFQPYPVVSRFEGSRIDTSAEVLLVNYQRLAASYERLSAWVCQRPTLVLLDEAHRMKRGRDGQWGTTCLNLAYLATRRDLLSGTPAPQSPADLRALLDFLWPNQARRILPPAALMTVPPPGTAQQVAEAIRPLFVRTTKKELGLRPPDYSVLEIPLTGLQAEIYQALRDRYAGQFALTRPERVSFAQMGQITMYLLEAATNPALLAVGGSRHDSIDFRHPPLSVPPGSQLSELLAEYGKYETPKKFIQLLQLVERNVAAGRKTLIWSNFVRNLETLERMLHLYRPALIHGGIPSEVSDASAPRTREAELARFRTDAACQVLLANPAATSEGVSLHEVCHDAIYLERTFNAGQYLQSIDRIHRLGMSPDQDTQITFLVMSNTIDEVVDGRVREKAERLGDMLNDPDIVTMALPDDEDYGPAIDSEADIAVLLAHLRGGEGDARAR